MRHWHRLPSEDAGASFLETRLGWMRGPGQHELVGSSPTYGWGMKLGGL